MTKAHQAVQPSQAKRIQNRLSVQRCRVGRVVHPILSVRLDQVDQGNQHFLFRQGSRVRPFRQVLQECPTKFKFSGGTKSKISDQVLLAIQRYRAVQAGRVHPESSM